MFCWLNVTFKSSSSYITDVNILYTHITWCSFKFVLYLRQNITLIFWLFKRFIKRRVSSHFVAKTTTCCICMWKLSFLKYGNTHLISELYYKIGRWFIFRNIIMFSVPLGSSSRIKGSFTHIRKIKFLLIKWAFCFVLTYSHIQPSFLYSGLSNHLIWKWQLPDILKAKSTFSNIWFPTATPFNAWNCSTLGNQSIHPVAYFYK